MMNKDFFYTWHKRTLQKHTEEVDIDAIWAAIEPQVDAVNVERKRRRGFLFFLSLACIGIIAAGFFSLFVNKAPVNTQHISNSSNTIARTTKEGTHIDANISKHLIEPVQNGTPTAAATKHTTSTATNTLSSQSILSPSLKLKDDSIQENVWRSSRKNSSPKVHLATPYLPAQDVDLGVSVLTLSNSANSNKIAETNSTSLTLENHIRQEVDLPLALPVITQVNPLLIEDNDELPAKKVMVNKKAPFEFSMGLYTGLAVVQKRLSTKSDSDAENLLQLRQETERNLELWNNGIKAKIKHQSGIHFSVGLQYARLAEQLNYDADHVVEDSIANQIIGYSNSLLGDRNPIYGYAPNNTEYDVVYDFYNYYHFLEIPVSIGYQKQFKDWNFGLRTTYVQNISLATKGRILDSPFSAIDLKNNTASPFKNKLAGSFEGGLTAGYRISPHLELGFEAYLRHMPNSISKDAYSINQQYSWTGLNASIQYIF